VKPVSINLKAFEGIKPKSWVAMTPDYKKVVAYSKSFLLLEKKVGKKKVVYMKVPQPNVIFAY
jgi:hypothetical protein